MLSYKLSKRESTLVLILAVMVLVIAWYKLVYEYTTDRLGNIRESIESTNLEIQVNRTRVERLKMMEDAIETHKANGDVPTVIPTFDNTKSLMTQLDAVLSSANAYNLSFDDPDTMSSDYVLRGMGISFECDAYSQAETVLDSVANGPFPCIINSVTFKNRLGGVLSANARSPFDDTGVIEPSSKVDMHVTFIEQPNAQILAERAAAKNKS